MEAETISELKRRAGSPVPYRVAAAVFWWALGLALLFVRPGELLSPASLVLTIAGITSLLYLFGRAAAHDVIVELMFWPYYRPLIAIRFAAWLYIGSPLGAGVGGWLLFLVGLAGLTFAFVAMFALA